MYQQIVVQATTLAYADAQFALGILAVVLMPLIFVLPRPRKAAGPITVSLE